MSDLYSNIKQLCKDNDITTGGLCDKLGMSRAILSNLKNGRVETLSSANIKRIADFFEVSVDNLMYGTEEPSVQRKPTAERLTEEQTYILDMFAKLNFVAQRKVMEYAEDLSLIDKYKKESA